MKKMIKTRSLLFLGALFIGTLFLGPVACTSQPQCEGDECAEQKALDYMVGKKWRCEDVGNSKDWSCKEIKSDSGA